MKKIYTLLAMAAITFSVNAQELLTNPGFESGYTVWAKGPTTSYTDPVISTTDVHGGTQSIGYTAATATTGFYQNVNITAGKTYKVSFWYKSSGDNTDSRIWSLYKTAVGGTPVYTTADATTDAFRNNNGYLTSASAWTFFTAEMPAGTGATILETAVRVYNGGTAQFDDFSVTEKVTLAVSDLNFKNQVSFNTLVQDKIVFNLPSRATVNIYSMDGKLVSSDRVSNGESLNAESLNAGFYLVVIDNGVEKISQKILKK